MRRCRNCGARDMVLGTGIDSYRGNVTVLVAFGCTMCGGTEITYKATLQYRAPAAGARAA